MGTYRYGGGVGSAAEGLVPAVERGGRQPGAGEGERWLCQQAAPDGAACPILGLLEEAALLQAVQRCEGSAERLAALAALAGSEEERC